MGRKAGTAAAPRLLIAAYPGLLLIARKRLFLKALRPERAESLQTVKKGRRPQKQHKFGERITRCRFLLLIYPKYCWPLRANAFAFFVVRLLPYRYTPTEAHSLPLQPFRQPPSVSKNYVFDTLGGGVSTHRLLLLCSVCGPGRIGCRRLRPKDGVRSRGRPRRPRSRRLRRKSRLRSRRRKIHPRSGRPSGRRP